MNNILADNWQADHVEHVLRAVAFCRGKNNLIDKINKNLQSKKTALMSASKLNNILTRDKTFPSHYAIPVELATQGEVTRHQLRPDLYPDEALYYRSIVDVGKWRTC